MDWSLGPGHLGVCLFLPTRLGGDLEQEVGGREVVD